MKKLTLLTTLATALAVFSGSSFAANVPAGTQLADTQEYHQALSAGPTTIDVNGIEETIGYQLVSQLFETLVVFDEHGKLQPGAAESWSHSDDYKVWTFNLRKDGKWSDGSPVVAQDFVTSFKRLLDPNNGFTYAFYLSDLNVKNAQALNEGKAKPEDLGVKALDDYTLEVTLDGPVPWFLQATALAVLAPVPTKLVEAGKWPNFDNYVTNGAYKLESQIANDSYTLVRNKYYWNDKSSVINKAIYYIVPQDTSAYKRLQSGEIDALKVASPSLVQLASKDKNVNFLSDTSTDLNYITFNLRKAPFSNKDARKAIQLAINNKQIEDKVLKDNVTATTKFIAPSIPGAEELTDASYFTQDQKARIAEANRYLEKAGYSKANPLHFTYSYSTGSTGKLVALAVQSQIKRAFKGAVVVDLHNQEWKTFLADRHNGKFDIATDGWGADYLEPSTFVSIWTCSSFINDSGYCSQKYDAAFDSLFTTKTDEERSKLYSKMNTILQDDAPAIIFYTPKTNWAVNPKLKGLSVSDNFRNLSYMYFVK